jgi:hypothetical protein
MTDFNQGSYRLEGIVNKTHNNLVRSEGLNYIDEPMLVDTELPTVFTTPFHGTYFRHDEVTVPKGRIVSFKTGNPWLKDESMGTMRACVTLANGGEDTVLSTPNGNYTLSANTPIGIAEHNYMRRYYARMYGNYPLVRRRGYIEVPYFSTNTAFANACYYGCGYDGNGTLTMGDYVMSDNSGKYIKYGTGAIITSPGIEQRVGQVIMIDKNLPAEGWLEWVMWDWMNQKQIGNIFGPLTREPFNPYDFNAPLPKSPDYTAGNTTSGMKPLNTDNPVGYQNMPTMLGPERGHGDLMMWPEQLLDAMGIPGLTDGLNMFAHEYTDTNAQYTKTVTGTSSFVQLAHRRIAIDPQGVANPDIDHPYPAKVAVYNALDLTVRLQENIDYYVDRYRGKIEIVNTTGAENWVVVYTSLEDRVFGVPTEYDFAGSIGGLRIQLCF